MKKRLRAKDIDKAADATLAEWAELAATTETAEAGALAAAALAATTEAHTGSTFDGFVFAAALQTCALLALDDKL